MDSALHVEYLDVVTCGVFVVIRSYQRGGLETIRDLTRLLRIHKDKQIHQMEWIPFDMMKKYGNVYELYDKLPTPCLVYLDPLSITKPKKWSLTTFFNKNKDDLYYDKV